MARLWLWWLSISRMHRILTSCSASSLSFVAMRLHQLLRFLTLRTPRCSTTASLVWTLRLSSTCLTIRQLASHATTSTLRHLTSASTLRKRVRSRCSWVQQLLGLVSTTQYLLQRQMLRCALVFLPYLSTTRQSRQSLGLATWHLLHMFIAMTFRATRQQSSRTRSSQLVI